MFLFLSLSGISQNQDTLKKELKEVVITGQFTETYSEDAVHKIRVIGNKKLNSGIYNDLGNILEKELNIKLSQDNVLGSSISLQGISGQNVKILIDDIPVIGRMNGNIDLSQINLNNVEQIEIIEGPLSTIYGTDALAGTINIITKKKLDYKNILRSYYESVGKYNLDIILNRKYKDNLIGYQFGRKYFNGWSEGQSFSLLPQSMLADTNRFKKWKPKEQYTHKLTHILTKSHYSLNNYIERFYEKITNKGMPQQPYFENAFDEYYYTYRTNLGSDIKLKNKTNDMKILLAYNRYERIKETFYIDLTDLSSNLVNNPSAQDNSRFELFMGKLILSNNNHEKFKYQLGLDLQHQTAKGQRILNKYQTQNNYALFSTVEYAPNKRLILRPSGRLINNTNYNAPFIPALNILYSFNNYKIRASYAKGFRAPDFKELFLNFVDINHNIVGNEDLLAEQSHNYNYNIDFQHNFLGSNIKSNISAFYAKIFNKIDLYSSTLNQEQFTYFNIEKFYTKGVSFNSNASYNKIELSVGASQIGRYNNLSQLSSIPKYIYSTDYNISAFYYLSKTSKLNLFYKYVGKSPNYRLLNSEVIESTSESYNMLDVSLNNSIYNNKITLTIGAKNLFDIKEIKQNNSINSVHSSSSNMSIGYGRSFFMQLNLRL